MLEQVLAYSAGGWGVVMALSPALQIRRMVRLRSSVEVSVGYFVVLLFGFALWMAYGISITNYVLIVPNAVAFTVCATTIAVALWYRRQS